MSVMHSQPQYDFITGTEIPQTSTSQSRREPLGARISTVSKPDASNEEWRAQIHKLKYEVDSLRQEKEATSIRHEDELRRFQSKAEADYKRAQIAENASHAASGRYSKAEQELADAQEKFRTEKADLERKLRDSQEASQTLQEEVEDLKADHGSGERRIKYEYDELLAKYHTLEQTVEEFRRDRGERMTSLDTANQRLAQRETQVGELENEVLRLKAQTGDVETLEVIKRELSEQVDHIKKLEARDLDQRIELKQLRKQQKSVDVVEEEKRVLESKLRIMYDLRKELSEAQLQRQILEDEKQAWTSYFDAETTNGGETQFKRPEDLASAYSKVCAENADLTYNYGKKSEELSEKDGAIQSLEHNRLKLNEELAKLKATPSEGTDLKARSRLERQRALAAKEVEYLRAQLKTFDDEQSEFNPDQYDAQKTARIEELEKTVDKYRNEINTLNASLSAKEDTTSTNANPLKRSHDTADDERLGSLTRKNRTLQDQLTQQTTAHTLLQKELSAAKSQLKSLTSNTSARTRILELRNNPTAKSQAIKSSMLTALREENESLLARLSTTKTPSNTNTNVNANDEDDEPSPLAQTATATRLRLELAAAREKHGSLEKSLSRLKTVFGAKAREYRKAVSDILGWDFDFQPNGRVRITCNYNPGFSPDGDGDGEGENSIVFDGEKGTMKCSGGPKSPFAASVDGDIRYWVDDKREVPCFLATLVLKFWDETTKAGRVI